ncbi:MAG: hypothetical protein LBO21_01325 [Synergistaceae bacterium]|jgi:hypothetical protein|nr:hypothetical protein [Synergistaceae bacterium]
MIKRILWFVIAAALFLASFTVTAWFLGPWESAGIYALDTIRLRAAQNGIFMTYQGIEKSGGLTPTFSVNSLDAENRFAKLSLSGVSIKLLPWSSLLARGGSCFVEFGGGEIDTIVGKKLNIDGGRVRLTASGSLLTSSNVRIGGDINVTGGVVYDMSTRSVMGSSLLLKVPEDIDSALNLMVSSSLKGGDTPSVGRYIESSSPGEWRIKQNASSKK